MRLACLLFVLTQLADHMSTAQKCEKLDAKLFAPCVNIGHTHSSIIPDYVNKTRLSLVLKSYAQLTSNCSESSLAMHCAYFVPMCKEGIKEPILPCQRVCADFMRGCGKVLRPDHGIQLSTERYAGMCSILRNEPASSGNCFEPKDFKISPNTVLPKVGVCNKLVVPMCNDLGYNHTVLSSSTQIKLFKAAVNTSVVPPITTNKTYLPPYMKWTFHFYPKCAVTFKKMFCERFFPPCYPGELKQYYAVCKSECLKMYGLCPAFFRGHLSELEYCSKASDGKLIHGYCAHDKWPKHWLMWPRKKKPTTNQPSNAIQPYLIAIAVVVPVVVLIAIAASVFFWRRHKVVRFPPEYNKHQDEVQTERK